MLAETLSETMSASADGVTRKGPDEGGRTDAVRPVSFSYVNVVYLNYGETSVLTLDRPPDVCEEPARRSDASFLPPCSSATVGGASRPLPLFALPRRVSSESIEPDLLPVDLDSPLPAEKAA